MAQRGTIIVCGDTGEAFADSMYEAVCFVGGNIAELGNDAVIEAPTEEDLTFLESTLSQHLPPKLAIHRLSSTISRKSSPGANCGTSTRTSERCGEKRYEFTPSINRDKKMAKANRYDTVVLLETINGFQKGEKGAVMEVYTTPYEAYDIEIVTNEGIIQGLVEAIRPEQIEVISAISTEVDLKIEITAPVNEGCE